ncbi:MAG TPA: hypothetical protein VJ486_06835 [Geothrix sp.]|nr:hypothetical protein [Geothrix sp.]
MAGVVETNAPRAGETAWSRGQETSGGGLSRVRSLLEQGRWRPACNLMKQGQSAFRRHRSDPGGSLAP